MAIDVGEANSCDVLIVGAGFSGLYMLHKCRELGLSAIVLEAGDDVGGTWYWNRYPGLRCDNESMQYSYSFSDELQQEWEWSERFSPQPEILRYLQWVAERLDLKRDIRFGARVAAAIWDDAAGRWSLRTEGGASLKGCYCIMATGAITVPIMPDIAGIETFAGEAYHTARWPDTIDFSGKRVGVIGTGSSGVQIVPEIAKTCRSLTVFVRTPPWAQEARNHPLDPERVKAVKARYAALREQGRHTPAGMWFERFTPGVTSFWEMSPEERRAEMQACWDEGGASILQRFSDGMTDRKVNDELADFLREKLGETVHDPDKLRKLTPTTVFGVKRLPIGTDYHATFNRPNVNVVALRETPIVAIRPHGVETSEGEIPVDMLIYATGYDAGTGALARIDIEGVDGLKLADAWADGPLSMMGVMVAGFPNLFTVIGPGSPAALSNVVVSIEQHVEWVADCLRHLEETGQGRIEADADAQQSWTEQVNDIAAGTLLMDSDSWYNGANVPGKPVRFLFFAGGVGTYRRMMHEIAEAGYPGFDLSNGTSTQDMKLEMT